MEKENRSFTLEANIRGYRKSRNSWLVVLQKKIAWLGEYVTLVKAKYMNVFESKWSRFGLNFILGGGKVG